MATRQDAQKCKECALQKEGYKRNYDELSIHFNAALQWLRVWRDLQECECEMRCVCGYQKLCQFIEEKEQYALPNYKQKYDDLIAKLNRLLNTWMQDGYMYEWEELMNLLQSFGEVE